MTNEQNEHEAQQRATIERVAEMIHTDERTLARILALVPGGNIVQSFAVVLQHDGMASLLGVAVAQLIRENPTSVANVLEHFLYCDAAADEWSNEKLVHVLCERLAIER
jgi:hypothetical protein